MQKDRSIERGKLKRAINNPMRGLLEIFPGERNNLYNPLTFVMDWTESKNAASATLKPQETNFRRGKLFDNPGIKHFPRPH
jgi:hypothetical protein